MTPMTTPQNPTAPTIKPTPPKHPELFGGVKEAAQKKTIDMGHSERLSKDCVGVRVNFSWFSTSRQVDKATKIKMADAAESTEQGFSASKRLMDSGHPVIKKANEVRRRVEGAFRAHTIPFNAFASAGNDRKPEPGVRLIEAAKYEDFHKLMLAFVPEIEAVQEELSKALPDIKEMDRKRLGKTFNEEDYPVRVTLSFSWGPIEVSVPSVLEKLAPAAYQAATARLHTQMEATAELAQMTILQEMLAVVESWTNALGPVERIYPKGDNTYVRFHGAEIVESLTNDDDGNIPEGQRKLRIRFATGSGRKTDIAEIGPLTSVEYADLQPTTSTNEKKRFHESTIEGMSAFLTQFRNVRGMIGDKPEVDALVQQIEKHIAQCGSSKVVVQELRDSQTFRRTTHELMSGLQKKVTDQLEIVRRKTRCVTPLNRDKHA